MILSKLLGRMIQHSHNDTTMAITGSVTTTLLWLGDYSPVVVILSALVTIGFTVHKWYAFAKGRHDAKQHNKK